MSQTSGVVFEEPLIPTSTACLLLGISRSLLYKWIREGRVKAIRIGKTWKIPISEVKRLKSV